MSEAIENLVNNYNTARSVFQENVVQELQKEIQKIFEASPSVTKLGFIGYTPYFNDGDPCHYGVCSESGDLCYIDEDGEEVEICHEETSSYEFNKETREYIAIPIVPEPVYQASQAFVNLIDQIPNEILEDAFDEGSVVFSRDGTYEVNDYSHE